MYMNLYAIHRITLCWFNRPRLNRNILVQATSYELAQSNSPLVRGFRGG